jgi:hypothetical protein
MQHPNANMATSSMDRISGSQLFPQNQAYNNFRIQTLGGNIVQGQINKIRLAEIMFPYNIPTIVTGQNDTMAMEFQTYTVGSVIPPSIPLQLVIQQGFYTGAELATAIQNGINTASISGPVGWPSGTIAVTFDTTNQAIILANTTVWNATVGAVNYFFGFAPDLPVIGQPTFNTPDLTYTMGFRNYFAANPIVRPDPSQNIVDVNCLAPLNYPVNVANLGFSSFVNGVIGSQYTGKYTDYIDICSPSLCQAQYVRDGNTNQQRIRRDLICRLYIATEISTFLTDPVGSRPFVIHRQFKNAKVMKWSAERSIDAIDMQLFDMYGLPIPLLTSPPQRANSGYADFALTFLVDEPGAEEQSKNVGYQL